MEEWNENKKRHTEKNARNAVEGKNRSKICISKNAKARKKPPKRKLIAGEKMGHEKLFNKNRVFLNKRSS